MKRHMRLGVTTVAALVFLLILGAPRASADTFSFDLFNTNVSSSALVTVNVSLVGNTATITFTADQSLGIIDGGAVDLNVSGAFSVVSATTNTEALSNGGTGNVDHIGSFALEFNEANASNPATLATVVLTGSWANAASVLTANGLGNLAGVHFKTSDTCTFYAGNASWSDTSGTGCSSSVPDGGMTLMLLGGVLLGVETLRRKFRV